MHKCKRLFFVLQASVEQSEEMKTFKMTSAPPNRKNTLQIPKISIDNVSIADSLYDELVFQIK